jgi:hypothetical protein
MDELDRNTGALRPRSRPPHPGRARMLTILLAAAAVVIGVTTATAGVLEFNDETPAPLQQAIDAIFAEGRCVTGTEATEAIDARLTALGYADWRIESRPSVQPDGCVAAGFVATEKRIVLLPASGPTVAEALEGAAAALMNECLGKEEAIEFISSVLTGLGQSDFTISTDGPLAYPEGQEEAVRTHIASGCFVYSAMGWDAEGRPVYYISGSDA